MAEVTGKSAEQFVQDVSETACIADFVFANPKYKRGKNERELCDLLIVVEKVIVVIQVKAAEKLRQQEGVGFDKVNRWNTKKQKEARDQVLGAKRALINGFCNTVRNQRRGEVVLGDVSEYQLLGLTVVDRPEIQQNGLRDYGDRHQILNLNFNEFGRSLAELSTVGDLVDYLLWRCQAQEHLLLHGSGELDVLAFCLTKRDQAISLKDGDQVILQDGLWTKYVSSRLYKVHKRVQRVSYLFDEIIERCHKAKAIPDLIREEEEGRDGIDLPQADYIRICERLQRFRRHERVSICNKIIEKDQLAIQTGQPRHYSELNMRDGMPIFVFVAHGGSRAERASRLGLIMSCCSVEWPDKEVVGVVSSLSNQQGTSLDYGYAENFKALGLSDDQAADLKEIRKELFRPIKAISGNEFDVANEIVDREKSRAYTGTKADQRRRRGFKSRKRRK